jgi:hypothetical protein
MPVLLRDLITVVPRFSRAINLERDAAGSGGVDGYLVTTTAEGVLARFAETLKGPTGHRAWTLTGPYGSGKSAFALFLVKLLGSDSDDREAARKILKDHAPDLHRAFVDGRVKTSLPPRGFCPVLVSGAPEPLLPALVRSFCRDIRRYYTRGLPPSALLRLEKFGDELERGKSVSGSHVVETITEIAARLQDSGKSQGILLVIDELGKFLEFAAREPERGDIYILQQLAEATAASSAPGLFLVTILHQSFERYVSELRPSVRDEWSKVQGRFEDVAFQEPPEQLLHLVAHAIEHAADREAQALKQRGRQLAETAASLGLAPRGMPRADFVRALARCAPLHPLTVLALVRLCRKFGQNQRSLFSFLISQEPYGFATFLLQEAAPDHFPWYGLPDLYDYVAGALGNGLGIGESATRWAEVQTALDRAASLPAQEIRIIKAVGLLSAAGTYGEVRPTRNVLDFAFEGDKEAARRACETLSKRSILVYRKHSQSFGLWQGSDIDIEARVQEAQRRLPEGKSIAQRLASLWSPRPLVAKRHSFQTGTLRYFGVRFADLTNFSRCLEPDEDADGLLIYALPNSRAEVEELAALAADSGVRERLDVLVAIPAEVEALREAVRELELLRWVHANTPELLGDAVAKREVRARLAAAEERVTAETRRLFSPGEMTGRATQWFHRGILQAIPGDRSLAHQLSEICDVVYEHTPRLRNELINRRSLSSAAAAARRNLIDAMITHSGDERLGIQGTPPEMSMYVSVLAATKIHRREATGYAFGAPEGDADLVQVWSAMESFFAGSELQRRSVWDLFLLLRRPPYGLKMGVIPVLFCAAALAHDTEVALYEGGAFIPELSVEVFERLLRSPERFELRRYRVEGVRREVFRRFAELLGASGQAAGEDLVAIVRPLYRFFNKLPAFSRQTKNLSDTALAVRNALFAARDPDLLLFEDLPRACGIEPFPVTSTDPHQISTFFTSLQNAFAELQRMYDDLLTELRRLLVRAFGLTGVQMREALRFRAQRLLEHAVEPRLRAFIHHLADDQLDDIAWVEAIATMLVSKAPRTWNDTDRAKYEVVLADLVRSFRHIEALVFETLRRESSGKQAPAELMRIGVTDRYAKEMETVVAVEAADTERFTETVIEIENSLERMGVVENPALALAALATVCRRFLAEVEKPAPRPELARQEIP